MALTVGNLVHETSITTGTGAQTLVAVDGKRTFNTEFGTGGTDVFDYFISNPAAAEWERGTGHLSSSTVLVRDTVIQSSNGDAAVSFTAGTKNVTNDLPAADQAGVWDLLETVEVSGSPTTIDIINLSSTYFAYQFIWSDLEPSANSEFWIRTDANNGASFDAGASDYMWSVHRPSMATSPAHTTEGDDADGSIVVFPGAGNVLNELIAIEVFLFNPSLTERTHVEWDGCYRDSSSVGRHVHGSGHRLSAALVDAIQFRFSTGNVDAGTLKVYGIRA